MSARLKRVEPLGTEPCGARRPGWERPGLGGHRLSGILPGGHEGEHRNAPGQTWAAPVAPPRRTERPARKPVRMCVRCHRLTDAPVVVSEVHQNSGPGFNVYACPDCVPHFPRVPDVLDLLRGGRGRLRDSDR